MKRGDKTCNYLVQILFLVWFSVWFFSPRKGLMDGDCCCGFYPDIASSSSAFCFFVSLIFLFYLFVSLLSDISFASYTTKTFGTHSLSPVTPQIIPVPIFIDVNIVCAIQGLSSLLNLIQAVTSMAEILLVVLMKRQEA